MLKKKFKISTIVLLSLIPLGLFYIVSNSGTSLSFGERLFTVKDISKVSKVSIYKNQEAVILHNQESEWKLEDGSEVDASRIKKLEKAVELTSIKAPVPKKDLKRIEQEIENNASEVMIFKGKRKIKHFLLFYDNETEADYMRLNKKDFIFEVHIPGYNLLPSFVYNPNKNRWKSNNLLSIKGKNIREVEIKYRDEKESDFSIKRVGSDSFLLEPNIEDESLDMFKTLSYFQLFTDIDYLKGDDSNELETLRAPVYQINIKKDTSLLKLEIFELINEDGVDPHTAIAKINNLKYKIKYVELDPFLKNQEYFLKND